MCLDGSRREGGDQVQGTSQWNRCNQSQHKPVNAGSCKETGKMASPQKDTSVSESADPLGTSELFIHHVGGILVQPP